MSEGIDFADKDARAVVITGIPFPGVKDPKVILKRKFLDSNRSKISGTEWYNLEAFRALNQAIGRVIRHKNDYGAVILLDKRFAQEANGKKLPQWLDEMAKEQNFRKGMARLAQFFHRNKNNQPKPIVEKRKVLKRVETVVAQEPDVKRKKIVIKPRQQLIQGETDQPTDPIKLFVRELKSKLEKEKLAELVRQVKVYKEQGDFDNLFSLLATFKSQNLIDYGDLTRFQPFVRRQDESAFTKLFN